MARRIGRIAADRRWVMSCPFSRICPAVGSSRRATHLPMVDLPLPDSPTRPRISPGPIAKDTPSTARTTAPRPNRPRETWKCIARSRTSRASGCEIAELSATSGVLGRHRRVQVALGAGVEAGGQVRCHLLSVWLELGQRRVAPLVGAGTPRGEHAVGGWLAPCGHKARDLAQAAATETIEARLARIPDRAQQSHGVRVLRGCEQVVDAGGFNHTARVQYRDAVG